MAKGSPSFVCQSCGAVHSKWSGKCEACGGWNTITEEGAAPPIGGVARRRARGRPFALEDLKTEDQAPPRRATGIAEFDRVCGGGLVPGSALLVGGDPGIGKSTLILQALAAYAKTGGNAVYISGEEAMAQVRLRAARMELSDAPVGLGAATSVEDILSTLDSARAPGIVAIDSIQTIWTSALEAAPGTPSPRAPRSSSSATSPRTARSPARKLWNIWSMPSSILKASADTISGCCVR